MPFVSTGNVLWLAGGLLSGYRCIHPSICFRFMHFSVYVSIFKSLQKLNPNEPHETSNRTAPISWWLAGGSLAAPRASVSSGSQRPDPHPHQREERPPAAWNQVPTWGGGGGGLCTLNLPDPEPWLKNALLNVPPPQRALALCQLARAEEKNPSGGAVPRGSCEAGRGRLSQRWASLARAPAPVTRTIWHIWTPHLCRYFMSSSAAPQAGVLVP